MQRLPRIVELLLIIALCGVLALWATRILRGAAIPVPPPASAAAASGSSRVDELLASARLFGSRRPGVLSDNVRALGVIADASGRGSVIVSVDGQAPKVYRVGDTLDGRLVSAIRPEEIELDAGGARQVFRLPAPRPPVSGLTITGTGPRPAPTVTSPQTTPAGQMPAPEAPPREPPGVRRSRLGANWQPPTNP
jgi:hypothetical protein